MLGEFILILILFSGSEVSVILELHVVVCYLTGKEKLMLELA